MSLGQILSSKEAAIKLLQTSTDSLLLTDGWIGGQMHELVDGWLDVWVGGWIGTERFLTLRFHVQQL